MESIWCLCPITHIITETVLLTFLYVGRQRCKVFKYAGTIYHQMTFYNLIIFTREKKAWIAAVLNFFFWGLGYLCYGRKKVFGLLILSGYFVLIVVNLFIDVELISSPLVISGYIGDTLISLALAYDVYKEVEK